MKYDATICCIQHVGRDDNGAMWECIQRQLSTLELTSICVHCYSWHDERIYILYILWVLFLRIGDARMCNDECCISSLLLVSISMAKRGSICDVDVRACLNMNNNNNIIKEMKWIEKEGNGRAGESRFCHGKHSGNLDIGSTMFCIDCSLNESNLYRSH